MTGMLALLGGGEWTSGVTLDERLSSAGVLDRVVIVPTATAYEDPEERAAAGRAVLEALGATVTVAPVLRRSDALDPASVEPVEGATCIYLTGGSPMHLRSVMLRTPFWDAVVAAFSAGAALVGSGESASVLGTAQVDPRGGAFTVGLGTIGGLCVLPHYEHWSSDTMTRTISLAPRGVPVAALDARTALIRAPDGSWSVDGPGRIAVFRDGAKVDLDHLPVALG